MIGTMYSRLAPPQFGERLRISARKFVASPRIACPRLAPSAFLCLLLTAPSVCPAAGLRFEPLNPEVGPFPTDALTVPDASQKTGRRVNLPLPDCAAPGTRCVELAAVNQLDGFNLRPRLRLRFTAPINPDSLRDGVYFIALDNLTNEEYGLQREGQPVPINEVIWDPATNTGYAKADFILDQHRRYLLVVSDAVRDSTGQPVTADAAFSACISGAVSGDYCAALARAVTTAAASFAPRRIIGASVFTTMSATAWLEKARAQLVEAPLSVHPAAATSVFRAAGLATLAWNRQVGVNPPRFNELRFPMEPGLIAGVGRIAFGAFSSPRWLDDRQSIPATPTGAAVPLPAAASEIQFTAYLPDADKPANGYPVVIFGHGLGDSRFGGPTGVAGQLAQAGLATLAISAFGHGYGPESTLTLIDRTGNAVTVPGGGRGVDTNGDGRIDAFEGCVSTTTGAALRDCLRQTALDLAQLVRAIRAGIDLDGDGVVDLDASRIYYAGQSLGSLYGVVFNAIEPATGAAVLNVGGGSVVEIARWSQSFQSLAAAVLGTALNDNYVLPYQPAKVNNVAGAIDLQNLLELYEWMGMPGDPLAYAPHLRASTLPGVPVKPVMWQIARADRTVPNTASYSLIRAANMRESTWLYRHDLARPVAPDLPVNPHTYLLLFANLDQDSVSLGGLRATAISFVTQQQMAGFLSTAGAEMPDPNGLAIRLLFGRSLFEIPASLPVDPGY